ncbi:MAG: histidine kinase dimerization/phospho-acceptor domain-containing protein [Candidatus Korobacteraceae bacterium]
MDCVSSEALEKHLAARASASLRLVSDLVGDILRGQQRRSGLLKEVSVGNDAPSQHEASAPRQCLPAAVAQEINNPLEVLLNLLQLVEAEPHLTNDGRRYLSLAREEIRRLAQIVRDSLDKNHATIRQDTCIPELLDEVLELYKSRFDSKSIAVLTRYRSDAHASVYRQRLRQAFSNLLLNAADALPVGGTIRLRVRPVHEWGGRRGTDCA